MAGKKRIVGRNTERMIDENGRHLGGDGLAVVERP
jgi:hypothetical protein